MDEGKVENEKIAAEAKSVASQEATATPKDATKVESPSATQTTGTGAVTPTPKKNNSALIIVAVVAAVLLFMCACCSGTYFFMIAAADEAADELSNDLEEALDEIEEAGEDFEQVQDTIDDMQNVNLIDPNFDDFADDSTCVEDDVCDGVWATIKIYEAVESTSCDKTELSSISQIETSDENVWSEEWVLDECGNDKTYTVTYYQYGDFTSYTVAAE